jgi:hypothetical protein
VLVFGVKELRNSLSSAGYRYWKNRDSEEMYLPSHVQVQLSHQHKVVFDGPGSALGSRRAFRNPNPERGTQISRATT